MPPRAADVLVLAIFASTATSCCESSLAGGFDSPVPAARLQAIQQAAAGDDRSPQTLRRLVEQLDSDDEAVRLLAITTLEELTGETLGFRPHDPPAARRAAITRWIEQTDPRGGGDHG